MEIDLDLAQPRTEPFRAQVCIVGAGIAGLTLAHKLAGQGIDVALLEAGGRVVDDRSQSFITAAHLTGEPHIGTHEGRFRVFGGASLRWGGQLLPLPPGRNPLPAHPQTLSSRPQREARSGETPAFPSAPSSTAWPVRPPELEAFCRDAERILAVDDLSYEAEAFFASNHTAPSPQLPGLNTRLSKWTPFSHRNLATTIGHKLLAKPNVTIYLHAQATELMLAPSRDRLESVLVRTLAGATFRFEAQRFIVAAGAIETARLLLASRSIAPEGVGNDHDQVGRNFHDHLTLAAASFTGAARAAALQHFRPYIYGATQHSLKFEADAALCQRLALNPILAHITLEEPADSGLAVVRDILTSRQRGDFAATLRANVGKLPAAVIEALRLGWQAKLHHRRFVSARTAVTLRFNAAQDAPSASRITLSRDLDPFGMPQPVVDWHISANEIASLRAFASHMRASFAAAGIADGIEWLGSLFGSTQPLANIEDARHAMGGACMGFDPRISVVDENLTVHGVANLYLAGPSVFPDGTPQLPTLTMMALTLRLARRLASNLIQ